MKQSSNWLLVILDHKKIKSLKWRFYKLLLHQFPLTYLILNSSRPLLSGSATPTQSAAADSSLAHGQNLQPIFEQEEDEDLEAIFEQEEDEDLEEE